MLGRFRASTLMGYRKFATPSGMVTAKMFPIILMLGVFGINPVWCDSCGEMYVENLTLCDTCFAMVCDYCVEDYEPLHGCFVCEEE